MSKIDIHTHILPENWPDLKKKYGYGGFVHLEKCEGGGGRMMKDGQLFREVDKNCFNLESRLHDMKLTGVDMQVLSTVPVMFSYWAKPEDTLDLSEFLNNHIFDCVNKEKNKFIGLGTLPMQSPTLAIQELKRCKNELGFPGVQIGTHVNGLNLDEAEFEPFFQTVSDLNCCLFVHPWDMRSDGKQYSKYFMPWLVGMPTETTTSICSLIFGGVLEKFPKIKICFAHGGGSFPYSLGRIVHGYREIPEHCAKICGTSPEHFAKKIYYDSLVHDSKALNYLVDVMGEDRVMLGSDYPFRLGEKIPGKLIEENQHFTSDIKSKLLYKNALDFLGLNNEETIKIVK